MATAQYTTYIVAPDSNAQTPGPPGPTGPQGPAGPAGQNNNTVYYNTVGGANIITGTLGAGGIANGFYGNFLTINRRSFPLINTAYLLTFNWQVLTATFTGTPNGPLQLLACLGSDTGAGNAGTLVLEPMPIVSANITSSNNFQYAGSASAIMVPQSAVNMVFALGNFTGTPMAAGATMQIQNLAFSALSSNVIVQTNWT